MDKSSLIYTDRLRDGHTEAVHEVFPAEWLDQSDADLSFTGNVAIDGEAYLADKELVLHLDIHATAKIPCAICNEMVLVPIELKGFYHAEPLAEIKSGIFDFSDVLREAVILEAPQFVKCGPDCTHRDEVERYLKDSDDDGYHPFADLDLNK